MPVLVAGQAVVVAKRSVKRKGRRGRRGLEKGNGVERAAGAGQRSRRVRNRTEARARQEQDRELREVRNRANREQALGKKSYLTGVLSTASE